MLRVAGGRRGPTVPFAAGTSVFRFVAVLAEDLGWMAMSW
jgi:hypothetical protein